MKGRIASILAEIDRLIDEVAVLTVASTPTPGGLLLSPVEFDLYEANSEALDKKFTSPWKVLKFLKTKLGYKRISEGEDIIVRYRQKASSPLVAYFDGKHGEVVGVDEVGRPWVHFRSQDWEKARVSALAKSRGQSPFDIDGDIVQSRLKALRLDPLDVVSYTAQLAKIGYIAPKGNLETKNWTFNLPKSQMPSGVNVYDGDDEDEDEDDADEDGREREEDFFKREDD